MSFVPKCVSNISNSLSESDSFSNAGSDQHTPLMPKKAPRRRTLIDKTRYYYNTFDSQDSNPNKYSYLYKREFNQKTCEFIFINNEKITGGEEVEKI